MGLLFQDPASQLVLPRVADDVAFGLAQRRLTPVEAAAQVSAALNAVGLRGFEDRWVHRLSLGEQKRVALAGLLVMEPALLLLDEPTAGLDSAAREMVLGFLARLPAAMLLTTHDLDATERLRARRLYLDGGRLGQPRSQGGAAGHPRLGANR
jgi:cobalt/nickel transport system ATP-binding protein